MANKQKKFLGYFFIMKRVKGFILSDIIYYEHLGEESLKAKEIILKFEAVIIGGAALNILDIERDASEYWP
jgi:hypothetical protein